MEEKQYVTLDEIMAEHEEWSKITSKARELFPHSKDVVYKLTVWCYETLQPRYPVFKIRETSRYFFHTLQDAQNKIPDIIEKRKKERKETPAGRKINCYLPYRFVIDEHPVGQVQFWRNEVQAWWVYDKKGNLVVNSLVSEMDTEDGDLEPFFGRLPDQCPVRKGDIVEVVDGDEVHLEIVYALPPDPAEGIRRIIRRRESLQKINPELSEERLDSIFGNDYSDDCYITLDGTMEDGRDTYMWAHSHPSVKWVLPARNRHRLDEMPKNRPSRMVTSHCSACVSWMDDSSRGHKRPTGGHRRVSGMVRACLKSEARKQILEQLMD